MKIQEISSTSTHFAMTEDEALVAYTRLTKLGEGEFKIYQIVVDTQYQGKWHGKEIINHVIEFAKPSDAKQIELNAQVSASDIYAKFGFQELGEASSCN